MSRQLVQLPGGLQRNDFSQAYDAVLVLSFGGPESPADVIPFLENVTRGRDIPGERLVEVAAHYHHFGGVSPINAQNRALIAALQTELAEHGIPTIVYFGNRNWHPLLEETVVHMRRGSALRVRLRHEYSTPVGGKGRFRLLRFHHRTPIAHSSPGEITNQSI